MALDENEYGEDTSTVGISSSRAESAGLRLRVVGPGIALEEALPPRGEVILGRSPQATIHVNHPSLSRQHASLVIDGAVHLQDLGSRNGTFVNGRRLEVGESVVLGTNEIVEIGEVMLVL